MQTLEIFFDYICPFCLRAHEQLLELLPKALQTQILWRPFEIHPWPERFGRHSDLCIQGMFFAQEHGADLLLYHERIYKAIHHDYANIEDIDVLTSLVDDFLDTKSFRQALLEKTYLNVQLAANNYAFKQNKVRIVPSFRLDGCKLDSVEGIGVSKQQLASFIGALKV